MAQPSHRARAPAPGPDRAAPSGPDRAAPSGPDRAAPSGRALAPDLASSFGAQLGFDFSQVRLHADATSARENQDRGSVAFTRGLDVHLGRGARGPDTTEGRRLLAHELTHVVQQQRGATGGTEALEQQAESAESGRSITVPSGGGPRLAIHHKRGDVVSVTVTPHPGGSASFTATLEGGGTATAGGSIHDLPEGTYWARSNGVAITVSNADGNPRPRMDYFVIPPEPANSTFVQALLRSKQRVPLTVTADSAPGGGGGSSTPDPNADLRRQLRELPDRIKAVLFSGAPGTAPADPGDLPLLLRIAEKLADLSDAELAEYAERTRGGTTDPRDFEASVDAWIATLERRSESLEEADDATSALLGMDTIYELYRGWLHGLQMGDAPSWIAKWEGLPVADLPTDVEGSMNLLYLQLRRGLAHYGYPTLQSFQDAITRFLVSFRATAVFKAEELLDRYEHVLLNERGRYSAGSAATAALSTDLQPARDTFTAAEQFKKDALGANGGWSPGDVNASYAAGPEYQRRLGVGRGQVRSLSDANPLLSYPDAPVDALASTSGAAGVSATLQSHITSGLKKVADTRKRISSDREVIYRLDVLVAHTKVALGIETNSIWDKIVSDHSAPKLDDIERDMMLAVLAVGLSILSMGSALAAGAALGLSSYLALETYEDYALRNDAYGAQLLSTEPSLTWVVLAIVGVVADLAMVAAVIRPIRPALTAFNKTGDLAALETALASTEERIRRSILARAELELRGRTGWRDIWSKVVPPGALRSSLGVELLAEQIGKLVYSLQLNIRRGVNTFTKWRLTTEAADLVGDINKLTAAQTAQLRGLYSRAVDDLQRIASHGRKVGMSSQEVDGVLQAWAKRGTGSADEVIAEMTKLRAGKPATSGGAWTPPKSWNGPAKHGKWADVRGNSGWVDDRPEVIRIVGRAADGKANPIPYREGEVDFSQWTKEEVTVSGLIGSHKEDMSKIFLAIAERKGLAVGGSRTARINAARDWMRAADDGFGGVGLRPHHAGGSRIQLVPKDVHKVQHTDMGLYDLD